MVALCQIKHMPARVTIAIIGASTKSGKEIASRLLDRCYLLLVAEDAEDMRDLTDFLQMLNGDHEVELIDCLKDACWEADIIVLAAGPVNADELAGRIKDVATQKIIVRVTTNHPAGEEGLASVFPDSKIVVLETSGKDLVVSGQHAESVEAVSQLFNPARQISNSQIFTNYTI